MVSKNSAALAPHADLRALKAAMRREARARRALLAANASAAAAAHAGSRLLREVLPPGDVVVAGFWPMGSEIDCRPILEVLYASGYRCCLPVVAEARAPLAFRRWTPEMNLSTGAYGEQIPPPDAGALSPDVLLVPGLAFDRSGFRIGYGAGFYDRTLAALRAEKTILAVGLAYGGQLVDEVPREDEDEGLDWILTDCESIACGECAGELRAY